MISYQGDKACRGPGCHERAPCCPHPPSPDVLGTHGGECGCWIHRHQPDGTESADPFQSVSLTATAMLNANLPIYIGNATVALGRSIELANLCHPKTLGESLPDTRTQPVSHSQSDFVTFFWWAHWLREEVSANLPNILHHLEWEGLNIVALTLNQWECSNVYSPKLLPCSCT